jgi:ribosomal protein L37AE/L43A
MNDLDACPSCHRPLMEIDRYGETLIGCVHCNRWGHPGDKHLVMELQEEDIEALRNLSDKRHKAEDEAEDKS